MSPRTDKPEARSSEDLVGLGWDLPEDPGLSLDPGALSGSSFVLRRAEGALWRSTRRITLATVSGGEAVVLSGAGSMAWSLLDRWRPFTGLCETLAETYGVSAERVAADLAPVLTDLVRRGLVVVAR